jgi:GAF domain-containing protein
MEHSRDLGSTARTFARMALDLHQEPGVTETVETALQFACQAVGCGHAGLLLLQDPGTLDIGAVTGPLVQKAADLQLDAGEGPGSAVVAGRWDSALVSDTTTDDRWPTWARGVADLGLRNVLAVRLHANATTLGILELFDDKAFAFGQQDVEVAHILAQHVSVAVASAQQEASLWQAVDSRKLIGQAQGILMERFDIEAPQAFAMLRRYSQDNNVKLREVARLLTETRRFPAEAPAGRTGRTQAAARPADGRRR